MTTDREKIVEAMAAAIAYVQCGETDCLEVYIPEASAALDALIDHGPTEGMVEAMMENAFIDGPQEPDHWRGYMRRQYNRALAHLKE